MYLRRAEPQKDLEPKTPNLDSNYEQFVTINADIKETLRRILRKLCLTLSICFLSLYIRQDM